MNQTAETIFQCEICLRQHDGAGKVLDFVACVPQSQDCGQDDCAEVKARRDRAEKTKREFRRSQTHSSQRHRGMEKKSFTHYGISRVFRSSCPPEDERNYNFENASPVSPEPPQLNHADEQSRFVAEGDGVSDCNRMLAILARNFNAADASRTSRGEWVSNQDLIYVHKIPNAHSRASQLRGSETLTRHPFIESHRLDVDTKWFSGGWCYSICFIEHSERLKRERAAINKKL